MNEFKVVSIDMFGTLVDVNSVAQNVWRTFLREQYTVDLADKYWNHASELVFNYFDEHVIQKQQYIPLISIFEKCYGALFAEIRIDFDPKEAARVLAYHHSLSTPFGDTLPFLTSVGKTRRICLSSDTDDLMLGDLTSLYGFDHLFTSDRLQAYKSNSGKKFFSAVIEHYNVGPREIIHIGDTSSDIVGAHEAGIVTCWLNRKDKKWANAIRPDYEAQSLFEVGSILGVDP